MLRGLVLVVVLFRVVLLVAPADILDTIAGVFNTVTSIPAAAVRAVWHAVKGVWDFFTHLSELLSGAWNWMVNGVEYLGDRAARLGEAAFNGLTWIAVHWVPQAVHWALGKAVAYAIGAVRKAEHWVAGLVADVVRQLLKIVRTVEGWARHAVSVLLRDIRRIGEWIIHATVLVFGILAHPARLVQWILAELLVPLIRYVASRSAPVWRWLLGAMVHLAPEFAHTIEDVLARIL